MEGGGWRVEVEGGGWRVESKNSNLRMILPAPR